MVPACRAEIARLKVADIDSQRMIIHGSMARVTRTRLPLSPTLLEHGAPTGAGLPRTYLFPHACIAIAQPISDKAVWQACIKAAERAGIRGSSTHLVRHSYATHLLEPVPTHHQLRLATRIWRPRPGIVSFPKHLHQVVNPIEELKLSVTRAAASITVRAKGRQFLNAG
jgi:integrase